MKDNGESSGRFMNRGGLWVGAFNKANIDEFRLQRQRLIVRGRTPYTSIVFDSDLTIIMLRNWRRNHHYLQI